MLFSKEDNLILGKLKASTCLKVEISMQKFVKW